MTAPGAVAPQTPVPLRPPGNKYYPSLLRAPGLQTGLGLQHMDGSLLASSREEEHAEWACRGN